jgi:hypothetical protein
MGYHAKYEWGLYTEWWKSVNEKQKLEIEAKKKTANLSSKPNNPFLVHIYTIVWVPAIKLCSNSILFLLVTIRL